MYSDGRHIDDAVHIDDVIDGFFCGLCGHHDGAALGNHRAVIFDETVQGFVFNSDFNQVITIQIERDFAARSQRDLAQFRTDDAVVHNSRRYEGRQTGFSHSHGTVQFNRAVAVDTVECELAVVIENVRVGDAAGRCDQRTDVYLRVLTEDDAVLVEDINFAVGVQVTHDLGGITFDIVENIFCAAIRLRHVDSPAGVDVTIAAYFDEMIVLGNVGCVGNTGIDCDAPDDGFVIGPVIGARMPCVHHHKTRCGHRRCGHQLAEFVFRRRVFKCAHFVAFL